MPRAAPVGRSFALAASCALVYLACLTPLVFAAFTLQLRDAMELFGGRAALADAIARTGACETVLGQAVTLATGLAALPTALSIAARAFGRPLSWRVAAHGAWSSFAFATAAWIPVLGWWLPFRAIGFVHRALDRDAWATTLALALWLAAVLVAGATTAPLVDAIARQLI